MIKIAVCDDEKQVRLRLLTIIQQYFSEIKREVWVAGFKRGQELLSAKVRFDIIFLDIEMPELNGIETAKKLRKWDVTSKIIYVTNYDHYQRNAYEVHAFDYISKPIKDTDIFKTLGEAVRYLDNAIEKQKCVFETEEGCLSLDGVRPCKRYKEIEVDYLDQDFKEQHGKYSGWTAQIIQHEIDHCKGIVI